MQGNGRNHNSGTQQTGLNQTASMRVSGIKSNYDYPSWFDNTMTWFEEGKISSQAFENAYANLTKQGLITLKKNAVPTTSGYVRPTFAHDSDKYGFDYLYGARDFQSDEDIWKKGIEPLHDKHKEQQLYIDKKIEGLYETRRTKKQIEQILIDFYGDDIKRLDAGHASQEDRISQKAGKGHIHNGGGESEECAWYDIGCKMDEGFAGLGKLALIGGAAIIGIWLLKMRLGKYCRSLYTNYRLRKSKN